MKQSKEFIYGLFDPRDGLIKYIGKTKNLERRFADHLSPPVWCKGKKTSWIKTLKKLGLRPTIEVLDEVLASETNFWERHYISLYKSWGFELKNMTIGGDGGVTSPGRKPTQEEIERRIESRRNNGREWTSEVLRDKMRTRMKGNSLRKGKVHREDSRKKMSDALKLLVNDEFRERMRQVNTGNTNRRGKAMSEDSKDKLRRPVCQKTMSGEIVATFKGVSHAIQETKITGIANCLTKKTKSSGGYLWEYLDEVINSEESIKELTKN